MNKIIASALLAAAMIVPASSFADTSCAVTNTCGGNGNPEQVVNVWGTTNAGVPHIQPGQTAADGKSLCPAWFTNYCVDITGTPYYKALFLR